MHSIIHMLLNQHPEMYDPKRREALRLYRYRGVDHSPISKYILTPYWNWAVTLLPMWMAPNLVTLIGFLFVVAAFCSVLVFVPDLVGPVHPAFYFAFALCFWIYSTMDNIDGKQARRTGSSSPLGELFDHGCDALNCPIGGIVHIAALGLGFSWRALMPLLISCWAFYLPTWEEYHTGILHLGVVNGPTEGLLAVIATMVVSGVFGPQVWQRSVSILHPIGLPAVKIVDMTIVGFAALFLFYYVPSCLWTVYRECRKKEVSFGRALSQLLPMTMSTAAVGLWISSRHSAVLTRHFVLFFSTVGIVFGKMATKIIYAHVAKCPFPMYTGLMFPLLGGSVVMGVLSVVPDSHKMWIVAAEQTYLWCYFVICVVGYANWIYHTINSICLHCDIYCLRLKDQGVAAATQDK